MAETNGIGSPGHPGAEGEFGVPPGGAGGRGGDGGHGGKGVQGDKGLRGDKGVSGEDTFMTQSLWLGWTRWTWVRLAFAFVVLASAYGFWHDARLDERADKQDAREEAEEAQEDLNQDYQACLRGNDTRQVIRQVVDASSSGTDLTSVEGFNDLDPATQIFFINLSEAPRNDDFRKQAYALTEIRNCEAEFPAADHDLPADPEQ